MATKKSKTTKSASTKVICQNCGAEVIIPDHEHPVSGTAIGKDSNLGTVILPTKPNAQEAIDKIRELISSDTGLTGLIGEVMEKIYCGGYIDVNNIVRRWIPAQCLRMTTSRLGFHQSLLFRGYDYGWRVLINDLKRQASLFAEHDADGVADRNRWYNKDIARLMAAHFLDELNDAVERMPTHHHKSRKYVKLNVRWLNAGKGVHLDELPKLFVPLEKAKIKIAQSQSPKTLLSAVVAFDKLRRAVHWSPDSPCNAFTNAYKAAGAYYTIKDLIIFEDCKMKVSADGNTANREMWAGTKPRTFIDKERSLEALERKATEVVNRGVADCGYELLGLLRDFLAYNNFDYSKTTQEWQDKADLRKALRRANKNRRSRK